MSFIIGAIYRQPHATSESIDYLEDLFNEMSVKTILGYINDNLNQMQR